MSSELRCYRMFQQAMLKPTPCPFVYPPSIIQGSLWTEHSGCFPRAAYVLGAGGRQNADGKVHLGNGGSPEAGADGGSPALDGVVPE